MLLYTIILIGTTRLGGGFLFLFLYIKKNSKMKHCRKTLTTFIAINESRQNDQRATKKKNKVSKKPPSTGFVLPIKTKCTLLVFNSCFHHIKFCENAKQKEKKNKNRSIRFFSGSIQLNFCCFAFWWRWWC